jgi:hypothetical protein
LRAQDPPGPKGRRIRGCGIDADRVARAALSPGSAGARARPDMEDHAGRRGKYPFVLARQTPTC